LGVTLSVEEDAPMQHRWMIAAGGVSFVAAALTFVSVFAYLALKFDYPSCRFSWFQALSQRTWLVRQVAAA
jgi:hypothetical protein